MKKVLLYICLCFFTISLHGEVVRRGAFSLTNDGIYLTVGDVDLSTSQYINLHRQIIRSLDLQSLFESSPKKAIKVAITNLNELKDEVKDLSIRDWRAVWNIEFKGNHKKTLQSVFDMTGVKSVFLSTKNIFEFTILSLLVKTSGIINIHTIRHQLLSALAQKKGMDVSSLSYNIPIFCSTGDSLDMREEEKLLEELIGKMNASFPNNKAIETSSTEFENHPLQKIIVQISQEDIIKLFIEARRLMPKWDIKELMVEKYIAIGEKSIYAIVSKYLGSTTFTKGQVLEAISKLNYVKNPINEFQPITEIAINLVITYHVMDLAKIKEITWYKSNDNCEEILLYPPSAFCP